MVDSKIAKIQHIIRYYKKTVLLFSFLDSRKRGSLFGHSFLGVGAASLRHWQQALAIFALMAPLALSPNVCSYNALIDSCGKATQWQQVLAIFEQMRPLGEVIDVLKVSYPGPQRPSMGPYNYLKLVSSHVRTPRTPKQPVAGDFEF